MRLQALLPSGKFIEPADRFLYRYIPSFDTVRTTLLLPFCTYGRSGSYKDFHDWVDKNDILIEAFPLESMGDSKRVSIHRRLKRHLTAGGGGGLRPRGKFENLMIENRTSWVRGTTIWRVESGGRAVPG